MASAVVWALLAKLTPLQVQEFIAHELKEGRVDNKKTPGPSLSAASVHYEFQVLHKALKQAVERQLIPRNPADFVKAPRGEKAELVVLTEEEVARLLDAVKESYLYMPTFLAIYTGMRLGEILGLRWQDVDLTRGQIHVNQANCQRKVGEPQFKKPKTAKGRRVIDISASVVQALKAHKKQQAKWRLAAGSAWQDFGLVCCLQDGRPMNPPNVSSHFADVTARLGLPVTFHGLRHTHASLLLKAGVPAKVISERLGHSTIAVTMDVYASVMPGMQREAANKLEDLLRSL
ncbi:MAG: site-specific integrase [Firmicutes bacterium]|nr:site-specific integrase [Bacillota bacterium]